ncbi:MAG: PrsW family intramembrane metalloprotease [Melioribacteraceae bacterium]|nr:PrsW family intramembrane metalloprotease [Melioribacteraceae bacterium]
MIIPSIIAAILPMLIYLFFLWKFDKNEPEPIKFVLYHFIYGATAAVILGLIGSLVLSIPLNSLFSEEITTRLKVIMIAPIVEELAKASLLFKTISNKNIDNLTDGLIYGGAIGLGFGMTENFLYFIAFGDTLQTLIPLVLMRTLFSAVMHTISTATVGGVMSLSKYSSKNKYIIAATTGILIAIFIHFVWNFSVSYSNTFFMGIVFMILIIAIFIITFYFSLKYENKIIKKELVNEIPSLLLLHLTSAKRFQKGWFLNPFQNRFIELTTKLAFRKHEVEISEGNNELYIKEIEFLRDEISELIEKHNYSRAE